MERTRSRTPVCPRNAALAAAALLLSSAALADHVSPTSEVTNAPTATLANSGGEGATWEIITSLTSGNPHTDLDFFRYNGDLYVAAGTLAIGPNAGGQTIHRLTVRGELNPHFVSAFPSASCVTDPSQATALQHDVEVTPKGDVIFNADWQGMADTRNPQLLLDATDGPGRCHDQVNGGQPVSAQPAGGIEIVDITQIDFPVEIGIISHIGEAHTVNVSPRRSHIAFAVTSDTVTVSTRSEEGNPNGSDQADVDGFELIDLSSCMNFPADASVQDRRDACRPQVYRYRFDPDWARGSYASNTAGGCHELELRPDDTLTCANLSSTIVLDMSGVFDDNGTPDDYTDDKPRGTPLPCAVRESVSNAEGTYATGAMVTDCVVGIDGQSLEIPGWLEIGSPSLEGVELVGFVNHNGRTLSNSAVDSRAPAIDVAVSHEAELTHSGRFLITSDERGGGIVPPDASCPTPGTNAGNETGNGGIHAYVVDQLFTEYPGDSAVDDPETIAAAADAAYARTPSGDKAIYRAIPRITNSTFCTAHVFHQIPGQNRIFMGWYGQGTQVVDYIEHEDGSFEFVERAWWVPEGAITWTSAVFAYEENDDGTWSYWGATSDLGRTAVDVYKVTLPAPPLPRFADGSEGSGDSQSSPLPGRNAPPPPAGSVFDRGGGALGWLLLILGVPLAGWKLLEKSRWNAKRIVTGRGTPPR